MKIYFAAALSNNSNYHELLQRMVKDIRQFGEVLTPWQVKGSITTNNTQHPDQQIHDQSVRQLEIADVLVAEITRSSLGVGYELCLAEQLDLPTVILYNSNHTKASAIITGARKLNVIPYQNWGQAKHIINNFLSEFK